MACGQGLLQRTQAVLDCQALNGAYLVAASLYGEHQTRSDWLVINQHCARSAHAGLASEMGPDQPKVVSEKVRQGLPSLGSTPTVFPIHRQCNIEVAHASVPISAETF